MIGLSDIGLLAWFPGTGTYITDKIDYQKYV